MTKAHTSEEIKNRLSNIVEAIGTAALEYISELEQEKEQLKQQLTFKNEKIKKLRKKLFDILADYEIGNYDSNIHQFYEDVYDVHNELMELSE